jgi:hypothetical protein
MICQPGSTLELTSTVQDANGVWIFAGRIAGADFHTGATLPVWRAVHPFTDPTEITAGPGVTATCPTLTAPTAVAPVTGVSPLPVVSTRDALAFTGSNPATPILGLALLAAGFVAVWRSRCQPQTLTRTEV